MNEKIEQLVLSLRKMGNVIIAFSGGVDSTCLVKIAHDILGDNAIAVTISSPMHPSWEIEKAKTLAEDVGIGHMICEIKKSELNEVFRNDVDRCYRCKRLIFSKIKDVAKEKNIPFIIEGSNVDETIDYRPGLKALEELNILSPFIVTGFTKEEIRIMSKNMNLETYDTPSFACLASRFPYGILITKERLHMVEQCEMFLRNLGLRQFRVRYHMDLARIEVCKQQFQKIIENADSICKEFKKQGFQYITLDIQGFRSGSLNEVLNI